MTSLIFPSLLLPCPQTTKKLHYSIIVFCDVQNAVYWLGLKSQTYDILDIQNIRL
jgi:hypothetical protein